MTTISDTARPLDTITRITPNLRGSVLVGFRPWLVQINPVMCAR